MIDVTTRQPLSVSNDGDGGPYIMVPVTQLHGVERLLKAQQVPYWVDTHAISLDGQPEVAVINLGHGADPEQVQSLLDHSK